MASAPTQTVSQFAECQKQIEEALSLIQTTKITNGNITEFYEKMNQQDDAHQRAMAEITAVQYSLYEKDVYEGLEEKIRQQAEEQMAATIEEQVKAKLNKLIPQDQQEQVSRVNQELDSIMIDLHNSESRRANSFLQDKNKQLNTIKMPNGNVSEHFPKTLKDLFELDEGRTDKLAVDYPSYRPEGSSFARVNQFLQFCGVRYQLVSASSRNQLLGVLVVRSIAQLSRNTSRMNSNVNMFGGSPLNRLSWLRPSHTFLNAIIARPTTKWLLFNGGKPLVVQNPSKESKKVLAFLQTRELKPLLGPEPYFGQGKERGEIVPDPVATSSHSPLGAARHHSPPIVFLGILEDDGANLPLIEDILKEPTVSQIKGIPFFSMEISDLDLPSEELDKILRDTEPAQEGSELSWADPRGLYLGLDMETAAIFAVARSMVDWNSRRKFCTACGSRTYSMWGGWKLTCTSLLPWVDNVGRKPCPTARLSQGLHNFTHPRTDAVVIMIAIDETGDKILLGRGRKFPGRFYSALAGFMEPAETFEDAVKREMWEEAGIRVWDVRYHSTQPWPYPANLMVGFYARADSKQPIRTDLDNELVDARWFTRTEILGMLGGKTGGLLSQADYKKLDETTTSKALAPALNPTPAEPITNNVEQAEDPIKLPPPAAIAGVLIKDWAEGKFNFFNKEGPGVFSSL